MINSAILFFVNRISVDLRLPFKLLGFCAIIVVVVVPERGWLYFYHRESWHLNNWERRISSVL